MGLLDTTKVRRIQKPEIFNISVTSVTKVSLRKH